MNVQRNALLAEEPMEDKYQWLEDVAGDTALDWVRAQNAVAKEQLEKDPQFETLRQDILAILDSDERIPSVVKHGDYYYNFWRDKTNPRGLWRRTTFDEYRKKDPAWEVMLVLDALG
jgi:prolyl oligopeptidase